MSAGELRVEAKVENLSAIIDFATATLSDACPMKERMHIELVTEEIFVNIASYAYAEPGGDVVIRRSGGEGGEGPGNIWGRSNFVGGTFPSLSAPEGTVGPFRRGRSRP